MSKASFYLIRHAQSKMNKNAHLIGGRSNETPLTTTGITQSRKLGSYLLKSSILPEVVFTSPARRTQETGFHSLHQMGSDLVPIISDKIQELSQGRAEGTPRIDVYTPEVRAEIKELGKDFRLPGGESMNEVGARMYDWIHEAAEEASDAQNIFVYTHGGAITYLASKVLDWSHAATYDFQKTVTNTSVSRFELSNGHLSVDYLARQP